jgi:hypothetical protein
MNFSSLLSDLINHSINGLKRLDPLYGMPNSTAAPVTTTKSAENSVSASLTKFFNSFIKENVIALRKNLTSSNIPPPPYQRINARIISVPAAQPSGMVREEEDSTERFTLVRGNDSDQSMSGRLKSFLTVSNDFLAMLCLCLAFIIFLFIMVSHISQTKIFVKIIQLLK